MAGNNEAALAQELLRKRLRPADYIQMIEDALEDLRQFGMNMNKNQIDCQKAIMAGAGQMLNKCLPDLRAIEVTPDAQSPVKFIFMNGTTETSSDLKKRLDEPEPPTIRFS